MTHWYTQIFIDKIELGFMGKWYTGVLFKLFSFLRWFSAWRKRRGPSMATRECWHIVLNLSYLIPGVFLPHTILHHSTNLSWWVAWWTLSRVNFQFLSSMRGDVILIQRRIWLKECLRTQTWPRTGVWQKGVLQGFLNFSTSVDVFSCVLASELECIECVALFPAWEKQVTFQVQGGRVHQGYNLGGWHIPPFIFS